jgi:FixJ family two-component response regulator
LAGTPMISIVDDDAWARSGIKDLVLALGYEALAFESAKQFVESGFVQHTTCLITDLQMPGLSGLELQRRLRREGHSTPIIFVTAYPNERHRARALKDGATSFLSKPFSEQTLVECLALAIPCTGKPSASPS